MEQQLCSRCGKDISDLVIRSDDTKNYSSAAVARHANPLYKEKHRQAMIASWQKRRMGEQNSWT